MRLLPVVSPSPVAALPVAPLESGIVRQHYNMGSAQETEKEHVEEKEATGGLLRPTFLEQWATNEVPFSHSIGLFS